MTGTSTGFQRFHGFAWVAACSVGLLTAAQVAGWRGLLVFGILMFGLGPALAQAFDRGADAMSPHGLVPPLYALFALGPLSVEGAYSDLMMNDYLGLQLTGLIGLRLGLAAAGSVQQAAWPSSAESWNPNAKPLRITAWLLLGLSIPSLATYAVAFGGLQGLFEVGYGAQRNLILAESPIFGAGFEWSLLGSALLAFSGSKYGSRRDIWLSMVGFVLIGGLLLATGQRNPIAFGAMFGFSLFHYGHRRVSARLTLGLIILGMVLAQLISVARFFLDDGLVSALGGASLDILANPALIAPWAANQFTVPPASLLEVIDIGGPPLLLGRSYFAASLVPFPFLHRLIMGSELSVAEWRMQTFYPESADTGAFFGFSPVTEAYMNFGSLGVPPMLFLYGFVIGTIYRRVRDRPTPIGVLALAGSVPMFMLNGLTNQASTLMYQWTRVYLMPCLLLALVLAATRKAARSDGSSVELSAEASIASETQ